LRLRKDFYRKERKGFRKERKGTPVFYGISNKITGEIEDEKKMVHFSVRVRYSARFSTERDRAAKYSDD
jgi:hypothetical protein